MYDYLPWGEVTKMGGSGIASDFLYTGHYYHDPSNLHLTHYRAYDPCKDKGTATSQFLGKVGQTAALTATGAGVASTLAKASPGARAFSSLPLREQSLAANNIGAALLNSGNAISRVAGAGLSAAQFSSTATTAYQGYNLLNN